MGMPLLSPELEAALMRLPLVQPIRKTRIPEELLTAKPVESIAPIHSTPQSESNGKRVGTKTTTQTYRPKRESEKKSSKNTSSQSKTLKKSRGTSTLSAATCIGCREWNQV